MNIITVSAVCIIVAVVATVFKQHNREYALFLSIVTSVVILYIALRTLVPVMDDMKNAVSANSDIEKYLSVMLKGLGICYIGSFASDICNDCSDKSLADKVELAAKVSIATLYVPILLELLEIATQMIKA